MRFFVLALSFFHLCGPLGGQNFKRNGYTEALRDFEAATQRKAAQKIYPGFKLLRAEEDYSFLKNELPADHFWEQLKYFPFLKKQFLSLGGESRSEFQVLLNENWQARNNDAVLFQRFMLHTDWHFGAHFRLFVQLKSGIAPSRNGPPVSLNEDYLDLHQCVAGFRAGTATLEIGRQELRFGSGRLVDVREGANVRQSFDGVRWILRKPGRRFDLFFYAYNPPQTGVFDNKINTDNWLWGAYYVWNPNRPESINFDFYYLGAFNPNPVFEEGSRKETRHSFGIRQWGVKGKLRYNNEAVFQTGTFGQGSIRAWTVSTELFYTLPGKTTPTPGLKAEIISGDRKAGDGDLQTFNPLYPRGGYFGLLALIGPANLRDIHPSLEFSFGEKWRLNFDWDFFWRHRLEDGIYYPSGRLNLPGSGARQRFTGHQPGIQLTFQLNRYLELEGSYFHFFTGRFLAQVTEGKPYSQTGISINFKF